MFEEKRQRGGGGGGGAKRTKNLRISNVSSNRHHFLMTHSIMSEENF